MIKPVIIEEKCNGCGLCVDICNTGELVLSEGKISFLGQTECDYCGECEAICPNGAINCYYDIVWDEESSEKAS